MVWDEKESKLEKNDKETKQTNKQTNKQKTLPWCVYDKDHMSALRIKNTSESDPRSLWSNLSSYK